MKFSLKLSLCAVLALAGCSQVLGLGDYELDPALDPAGGAGEGNAGKGSAGEGNAGGQGNGGSGAGGGDEGGGSGEAGAAGAGGSNPVLIDCDSSECCLEAGGTIVSLELLPNGDFETNRAAWGMNSQNEYPIFTKQSDDTIDANSGSWFAWIGGSKNDVGALVSPPFEIPEGTGWLRLEGYRLLAFDSLTMTGDYVLVGLYDAAGDFSTPEELFFLWDSAEYDDVQWQPFEAEVPTGGYVGLTHHISVAGVTDDLHDADPTDPEGQFASNFFFDDLSFQAQACVQE